MLLRMRRKDRFHSSCPGLTRASISKQRVGGKRGSDASHLLHRIPDTFADEAFYDLDGPPVRITTPHIPLPAADILEDIALPTADRIVDRVRRSMQS